MNMDVQKGLRKRKLTSFFTMTYGHPPKLNPIRYDSSAFCSSTIRNGSPERLNFSAKFQRFIQGINAKAPGSRSECREVQGIRRGPGVQRCKVFECMQESRKGKFIENNSSAFNTSKTASISYLDGTLTWLPRCTPLSPFVPLIENLQF